MSRANYEAICDGEVILVTDLYSDASPTMTVTNDAEAVVREVVAIHGEKRIAYRDTEGQWDELQHERGVFKGFAPGEAWPADDPLRHAVGAYT